MQIDVQVMSIEFRCLAWSVRSEEGNFVIDAGLLMSFALCLDLPHQRLAKSRCLVDGSHRTLDLTASGERPVRNVCIATARAFRPQSTAR